MAAPTENMADDNIDILSSNFDPLIALYSSEINLPFPDVKVFNNVAEYESSLSGKAKQRLPNTPAPGKSQTVSTSTGSQSRARHPQVRNEPVLQMPDDSMPAVRRRMLRNVITRMDQSFVSGPLSILRRCMQEKLKAYIWTRSARSVRGLLKGYIIAFDKHFNLALMDVDEIYKIPSACRKKKKNKHETDPACQETSSDTDTLTEGIKSRLGLHGHEPRRSVKDRRTLPDRPRSSHRHSVHQDLPTSRSSRSKSVPPQETPLQCEASWLGMRREDVRYRHVNQLFVRGDNVVCVNIVNKDT